MSNGSLTVKPAALDDHGGQHEQDVRSDGDVRGNGIHRERPGSNGDTITGVTLTSPVPSRRLGGRLALCIVPSAAVGTGLGNYAISYVNGN